MKLLVANRSEIAVRIFQACREMNIPTVGIYTALDHEARHVTFADEVVEVQSYLDAAEIVRVAKDHEVTLIHPGYGFLSERPHFAKAVEEAGIGFVGPRAETMEVMGGKIEAKDLAEKHQVPTLPWARVEDLENQKALQKAAQKIGFPLLMKAAAGGGGKGMRRVDSENELLEAAQGARNEAIAAFGDGALFLEKLVLGPRHIEVQVFGDGKGGGVHLGERECTLQRRHQKIWEEAPAVHLRSETREGLYQAALNLVKATCYRSAGTVEFLVDENENFYFLEMNTRLQVEHPVTELISGVDLVRAQILLALEGESLQKMEGVRGHAIEVRIYAEDPSNSFMPTPGRVQKLIWPTGPGIRVDSGIEEGQTITVNFDPMIAKLVVHGVDRAHALARLRYALEETVLLGLGTNQAYLRALCDAPEVIEGKVTTAYLGDRFGDYQMSLSEENEGLLADAYAKGWGRSSGSGPASGEKDSSSQFPSPFLALGGSS